MSEGSGASFKTGCVSKTQVNVIIKRVSKGGIILEFLRERKGKEDTGQSAGLNKSTDLRKCPCVRKTLKADAKVGFHITEWEDFCLEEAQTRYKYA